MKDTKGGQTPLYLAVITGQAELAALLIKYGADYTLSVLRKRIYPDLMGKKMPGLDPGTLPRASAPLASRDGVKAFDRLADIIHASERPGKASDEDLKEFRALLGQCDVITINTKEYAGSLLLQKAAQAGLGDLVELMIEEASKKCRAGETIILRNCARFRSMGST